MKKAITLCTLATLFACAMILQAQSCRQARAYDAPHQRGWDIQPDNHDSLYVNLTGDTMTGALNMGNNGIVNINWAASDDGSDSELDADLLDSHHATYFAIYSHLHDTRYVNLAGDTMSGGLDMGNQAIVNIDWANSDDGTDSGLDADLLDGQQGSYYMPASTDNWVDETGDTMSGVLNMGNQGITNIDWSASDDGTDSGLDADMLDGQHASDFGAGGFAFSEQVIYANDTLSASDVITYVDGTSNSVTVTLPAAGSCSGQVYWIKRVDASTWIVTVHADDEIDGASDRVLSTFDSFMIHCSQILDTWYLH